MEHAGTNYCYHLYVLHQNISPGYKSKIDKQVSKFTGFKIDFIDATEHIRSFTFTNLNYSIAAYFRLLIPYIFEDYSQVIYLDCDIICLADIAKLIEISAGECLLNGVRDFGIISPRRGKGHAQMLGLRNHKNYFNSGVLVINTREFRENVSKNELLDMASKKSFPFPEQDTLNVVCEGRVHYLPMAWNVMDYVKIKNIPRGLRKEHGEALKKESIIHYVWDKPWKQITDSKRYTVFWEYAERTPFVDSIYAEIGKSVSTQSIKIDGQKIYGDIRRGSSLGIKFIVRCGIVWMVYKLKKLLPVQGAGARTLP
jgi:lipopolysaccharide biosynthesis glycosyltransferase